VPRPALVLRPVGRFHPVRAVRPVRSRVARPGRAAAWAPVGSLRAESQEPNRRGSPALALHRVDPAAQRARRTRSSRPA
ncbi:MAG TPA: hypothetical protein VK028_12950, partial [Micromonosporaceae bacterium]|nr:hypothetical protein [Micromonosporaceae bacterium]